MPPYEVMEGEGREVGPQGTSEVEEKRRGGGVGKEGWRRIKGPDIMYD